MRTILGLFLLFLSSKVISAGDCSLVDWTKSFDSKGYSNCKYLQEYINGLYRSAKCAKCDGGIQHLEKAQCCIRPVEYDGDATQCVIADWSPGFDRENGQVLCQEGFFLQGMYRGDQGNRLGNIEYGRCCKPARHPRYYGECYMQDVTSTFNKEGTSQCREGFFIIGFKRSKSNLLRGIEEFKCCKLVDSPPLLESMDDVKTRVMDETVKQLAELASYLGYAWSLGCRAEQIGDDFKRKGDSWEADKRPPCDGYMADHRLKMHYKHFTLETKDIEYGKPVIQDLQPQGYDSGTLRNNDPEDTELTVKKEIVTTRLITHTTTSNWEQSHEAGLEVSYQPSDAGGFGAKFNYKFGYKNGNTEQDANSNTDTKTFSINTKKTVKPNKSVNYKIMVSKTRTTVPYTAIIIAKFSAELDGFLRWGGGYNGNNTNFHSEYRGSGDRPTVKYSFGSASKPFYKDLKRKARQAQLPWQWHEMKQKWPGARGVIDELIEEGKYEFTLSGKFEDIVGTKADVTFDGGNSDKRDNTHAAKKSTAPIKFQPQPGDPPPVNPPPPVVKINAGKEEKTPVEFDAIEEESSGDDEENDNGDTEGN